MTYTVLARKYRSRTLDELCGQEVIVTTLQNALRSGRVHHGYLFTGTRGVGKTSTARILAKSLNCLSADGPTVSPCGTCEACSMIAEGEDIDVIEIDAASNTGVDNIRELRSNAAYRPARSRYKVYIIDEVHMLSTGAFNALLKTLEEPPEHVKFILATTEVQKVPLTIQSRCQRFDFRAIGADAIEGCLRSILESEGVTADPLPIRRVARLARGSMRDALSLLDQLLASGATALTEELVDELLPAPHSELLCELVDAVAAQDAAAALKCVEACLGSGHTAERLCDSLIEHLRNLMVLAVCGQDSELVDIPGHSRQRLTDQAQRFDAATYVYMIALIEELRRAVKTSAASRALLDATVVRMAQAADFTSLADLLARLDDGTAPRDFPASGAKKKTASGADRVKLPIGEHRRSGVAAPLRPLPAGVEGSLVASDGLGVATSLSSVEMRQVMDDPRVKRVLQIPDSTLIGVRRVAPAPANGSVNGDDSGDGDG